MRAIASTGGGLGAALSGGLLALSGGRHGGMTDRVEAVFDAVGDGDPLLYLRRRLDRGEQTLSKDQMAELQDTHVALVDITADTPPNPNGRWTHS